MNPTVRKDGVPRQVLDALRMGPAATKWELARRIGHDGPGETSWWSGYSVYMALVDLERRGWVTVDRAFGRRSWKNIRITSQGLRVIRKLQATEVADAMKGAEV